MYRDRDQLITHDQHNFVLNHTALGDMITSLPAIVWARKFYHPAMKMRVWVPEWQMDLVRHLLQPYGEFEVADFAKLPLKHLDRAAQFEGQPFSYNASLLSQYTRCRVHMVDYAFNHLLNSRPETMEDRSYPTAAPLGVTAPAGLYGPYVVFPVGATSDNKLFRASVMQPVMEWCLSQGLRPVIVGTKTSHTRTEIDGQLKPVVIRAQTDMLAKEVFDQCLDLREKTTLLELRDLLGYAAAVVGVDGGTLHLAGTTDAPIVYASGTTLPKHRYIARHGDHTYRVRYIGPRDLECYGCQSNWPMTTLNFTECAYGDNACMEQLHPDDFIQALKEVAL